MPEDERPIFLGMSALREGFEEELSSIMRERMDALRSAYINPSNTERYYHGHSWRSFTDDGPKDSDIATHEHETSVPLQKIVDHDLSILIGHITEVTSAMFGQFQQHLFETLEEATAQSGNIVDASKSAGPAEAFAEVLEKIEFGVDEEGKVSRPSVHMGAAAMEKMEAAIKSKGPDFEAKIAEITERKEREALEREAARKSKFARLDD